MRFDFYEFPRKEDKGVNTLIWNVFDEDVNKKEIVVYNLLEKNGYMWNEVKRILKENKKITIEDFSEKVRRSLMHMYWSRCEYECVITSWPPYISADNLEKAIKDRDEHIAMWGNFYCTTINLDVAVKIDVYTQVELNWCVFIKYLWNNKEKFYKPRKSKSEE